MEREGKEVTVHAEPLPVPIKRTHGTSNHDLDSLVPPLTAYYFTHAFTDIPTFSPPLPTTPTSLASSATTTVTITSIYRLAPGTYTATLTFANPLVVSAYATETSIFTITSSTTIQSSTAIPSPTPSDSTSRSGSDEAGGQSTTASLSASGVQTVYVTTSPAQHTHPSTDGVHHGGPTAQAGLSRGAIAGVSVASVVMLHLVAGIAFLLLRRRRRRKFEGRADDGAKEEEEDDGRPAALELQDTGVFEMGGVGCMRWGEVGGGCGRRRERGMDGEGGSVGDGEESGPSPRREEDTESAGGESGIVVPTPLTEEEQEEMKGEGEAVGRGSYGLRPETEEEETRTTRGRPRSACTETLRGEGRPGTRRSDRHPRTASEERPATRCSNAGWSIGRRRSAPWVTRWD